MRQYLDIISQFFTDQKTIEILQALLIFLAGLLVAKVVTGSVVKMLEKRFTTHETQLFRRGIFYGILSLFAISALNQMGFNLSVVLGAAGIFSVAIGFASQTSASNLISGLFLLGERPFSVGDIIRVGTTTGEVLSIDLLSVKLRTFDNLYVRIPNESLIKSEMTTLTKFPIRRFDMQVGVAYKEDLSKVRDVLFDVAKSNHLCLEEPKPLFIFQGFGNSSLDIQFSVWAKRENYLDLRNSIYLGVKEAFDAADIEIPFPHMTLYTGSVTDPFPVRFTEKETADASPATGP
ncbi:MAG: mechanosensitive ion channel family protein [Desulfobulbaceae bacterium]|uniref:Mechanosensitive ion channel family protein n=1 Tax=Candidatus Desulfobia pelagia TaxID=2841692 RepID=A0A8J6NEX8_9BACT|nr:mechanosensitive ion channel family protein [Candidatus Desulfobia pelagia]